MAWCTTRSFLFYAPSTHHTIMQIPPDMLSPEALRGIAMEFVSREGTDYGHQNWDMDTKVAQVLRQIDRGDVVIYYNTQTQTCNLLTHRDAKRAEEELAERFEEGEDYDERNPPDDY